MAAGEHSNDLLSAPKRTRGHTGQSRSPLCCRQQRGGAAQRRPRFHSGSRRFPEFTRATWSWSIAASLDGSAIYYGVKTRVYRSTDQGATRQLRGTLPLPELRRHRAAATSTATTPQTVYAAAYGGVYHDTDGAASWQPLFLTDRPEPGWVCGWMSCSIRRTPVGSGLQPTHRCW